MMVEVIASVGVITDAYKRHCMIANEFARDHQAAQSLRFTYVQVEQNGFIILRGQREHFNPASQAKSSAFAIAFKAGDTVNFYVRLTPSIKKSLPSLNVENKMTERVVPIKSPVDIEIWYAKQVEAQGAKLSDFEIIEHTVTPCSKNLQMFNDVFVKCQIMVTHPNLFNAFLNNGAGKRKSFGYGLPLVEHSRGFQLTQILLSTPSEVA